MKVYKEEEIRDNYHALTCLLLRKNLTVTTMESATCGQIASLITDTEGASRILKGAFITYSNEAKIQYGVSEETIERYSVYSVETASEMAEACRKAYGADIGIGITGTTGNVDPANAEASVPGQMYFSVSIRGEIHTCYVELPPQSSRFMYKMAAAQEVFEVLYEMLYDGKDS